MAWLDSVRSWFRTDLWRLRRPHLITAAVTSMLLFGTCVALSGCDSGIVEAPDEEDPDFEFETEPGPETYEVVEARIEPAPGNVLVEGVVIEEASAREGDLPEAAFSVQTGHQYAEGRRCLLVSGRLRNTTTGMLSVEMWVDGYNARGERVSSTLVSDTQQGHLYLPLPGEASREFQIVLNWSSRLSSLQIRAAGEGVPVPTSYDEGQVLAVAISPEAESFIATGIILEEASACVGTADETSYNVQRLNDCSRGDWYVLVSGQIRNTTKKMRDVDMWVDGYDSHGEQVASTLASETQEGFLHLDVAGETSQDFEIAVSWSDEIETLNIVADIDDRMIPSPPFLPSSYLPQGLTLSPSVGEYLPGGQDEPSDLLLLAVEVEWIESPKEYWSYRTLEEKHTISQGEQVILVSGVIQNRHRTFSEISMHAYGSDASGEHVSWTLDNAHLPGCIGLDIEPGQVGEFMLHMNPAANLKSISLYGGTFPIPPP